MKKNSLTKQITLLAAVLLSGMFASCVYDKDVETKAAEGDGKLIININSSAVGAGLRAATVIPDGNSSTNSTAEETITTMAIGVFSADGTTKKCFKYLTGLSGATDGWSTVTEYRGLTNNIAATDKAYVVANVTEGVSDLLEATTTADDFKAVVSNIDQSMIFDDSNTTGTVNPAKLPMYGSGTVAAATDGTSGNFEVTVNVIHMVAKVTLNTLTLSNVPATTQFTPKAIFLINVPEKLDFGFTTDGDESTYQFTFSGNNYFQGESAAVQTAAEALSPALTTRNYRDYLGTGTLSVAAVTTSAALADTYTFYTMPNNTATATKLVIAGEWSEDSGSSHTDVWYNIDLKNVATDGTTLTTGIYPNRHYKVNVDIRRSGALLVTADATGAYNGLTTQNTVNTEITISTWGNGAKSTEFGGNGGTQDEN